MPKYHTPLEYLEAARNPGTSAAELNNLASAPYDFVWIAVARNPSTRSDILRSLIPKVLGPWNAQHLAESIAQHANATDDILESLGELLISSWKEGEKRTLGTHVGVLLCTNPKTPFETIAQLLMPDALTSRARGIVARVSRRSDVLQLLSLDRSETVRTRAQRSLAR